MFLIENEKAVKIVLEALRKAMPKTEFNQYRIDRTSITFYGLNQKVIGRLRYQYRGEKLFYITEVEIPLNEVLPYR